MRVYLAGPMTGIPQFNIPAFDEAAAKLRGFGHDVVSPAEVDGPITRDVLMQSERGDHADLPQDESWSFYLARDFRILVDQDIHGIVLLPGWEGSKGARLELAVAKELGIDVFHYDTSMFDGLRVAPYSTWTHLDTRPVPNPSELYEGEEFVRYEDNPLRQRSVHGGVKDNRGKSRVDLIPARALMEVGLVMEFGARKYKPHNWRLGLGWSDTLGSALRHLYAFSEGEDIDSETGLSHVAHAACQVMFLLTYVLTGAGTDDRFVNMDKEEASA